MPNTETTEAPTQRMMWERYRVGAGNKRPGSWAWREVPISNRVRKIVER